MKFSEAVIAALATSFLCGAAPVAGKPTLEQVDVGNEVREIMENGRLLSGAPPHGRREIDIDGLLPGGCAVEFAQVSLNQAILENYAEMLKCVAEAKSSGYDFADCDATKAYKNACGEAGGKILTLEEKQCSDNGDIVKNMPLCVGNSCDVGDLGDLDITVACGGKGPSPPTVSPPNPPTVSSPNPPTMSPNNPSNGNCQKKTEEINKNTDVAMANGVVGACIAGFSATNTSIVYDFDTCDGLSMFKTNCAKAGGKDAKAKDVGVECSGVSLSIKNIPLCVDESCNDDDIAGLGIPGALGTALGGLKQAFEKTPQCSGTNSPNSSPTSSPTSSGHSIKVGALVMGGITALASFLYL